MSAAFDSPSPSTIERIRHALVGLKMPRALEALAYGEIMGNASRQGRTMTAPDGMIAAIARLNGGRLATRNISDLDTAGLDLVSPWNF